MYVTRLAFHNYPLMAVHLRKLPSDCRRCVSAYISTLRVSAELMLNDVIGQLVGNFVSRNN